MRKLLLVAALFITACSNNSGSSDRWVKIAVSERGAQIYGDTQSYSRKETSAWIKLDFSTSKNKEAIENKWKESLYFLKADCEKNRMKSLQGQFEYTDGKKEEFDKTDYFYPLPGSSKEKVMNWLCGK